MKRERWTRWVRFSIVGALGLTVQVSVLTMLLRGLEVHYLWATALAVEAAVLHNFWWHERWTWRDRPSGSVRRLSRRLFAFHAVNGTISLAGNVALVGLLAGALGVDPIAAGVMAVAVCSVATFTACERQVFARTAAATLVALATAPLVVSVETAVPPPPDVAVPSPQPGAATLEAWNSYSGVVSARHAAVTPDTAPLFALDAYGITGWREAATAGRVAAFRLDRAAPDGAAIRVPDGAIHHWVGAIYVPGISPGTALERVMTLAGHESVHYEDVLASRLLAHDGDSTRVFMKLRRTKVITVTYNTEHAVEYRPVGHTRAAVRSVATRIAELEHAGTPREREKPPESDSGYLWRLNAYWRYEAAGTGVLIECESVSLSRSVPVLLRPFIAGVVEGLARESLERTLVGLRRALTAPANPK
jgi:putative flippase GtrA